MHIEKKSKKLFVLLLLAHPVFLNMTFDTILCEDDLLIIIEKLNFL